MRLERKSLMALVKMNGSADECSELVVGKKSGSENPHLKPTRNIRLGSDSIMKILPYWVLHS